MLGAAFDNKLCWEPRQIKSILGAALDKTMIGPKSEKKLRLERH